MAEPSSEPFSEAELAAARRELVKMPGDLRRQIHGHAHKRGVDTVNALAWYMREERARQSAQPETP